MNPTAHRPRRISGVFEIRAATLRPDGEHQETAGSNPAQRTVGPLAPVASQICLVIPVELFDRNT
jgi:hypothetical protein